MLAMLRSPLLLLVIFYGVGEAFMSAPGLLAGRGNAVYSKAWGLDAPVITQRSNGRRAGGQAPRVAAPRSRRLARAMSPPQMSLMGLADKEILVNPEVQESVIGALSIASSVCLLGIIGGAVYLTLIEWQNKKDQKKADEVILSTGKLPPDGSSKKPGGSAEDSPSEEEEGNRYNRRMAKKARKKNK